MTLTVELERLLNDIHGVECELHHLHNWVIVFSFTANSLICTCRTCKCSSPVKAELVLV